MNKEINETVLLNMKGLLSSGVSPETAQDEKKNKMKLCRSKQLVLYNEIRIERCKTSPLGFALQGAGGIQLLLNGKDLF